MKTSAFLLDVDHFMHNGASSVRLVFKSKKGKVFRRYDVNFPPYFYLDAPLKAAETLLRGEPKAINVSLVKKLKGGLEKEFVKVEALTASEVPNLKNRAKALGDCFEYDVPYTRRYVIDKQLLPNSLHEIECDGLFLKSIKALDSIETPELNLLSLDIESANPEVIPDAKKDPCLMIGFYGVEEGVYSHSKKFSDEKVKSFASEKEMLEEFSKLVRKANPDVICTYNGDQFDLPFLQERADKLRAVFKLGRDASRVRTRRAGLRNVSEIGGRIHYDVYPVVALLNFIGTIKVQRLRLADVYSEVLGGKKLDVKHENIYDIWTSGSQKELDYLAEYNLVDAKAAFELSKEFMHLQIELGKLVGMPLFDASRATSSQLVETLLMREAFKLNEVVPNKPHETDASPIQGAFVKTPDAGVYENLAMLDFKSLYPSIIVSHNIDYSTLGEEGDAFVSPQGYRFSKKRKGILPLVLNKVLDERFSTKEAMKKLDKNSQEYKALDAKQWGLKILANSFYGYLLYARSRWYSREAGEATTAWAREFIHKAMTAAESKELKVIYGDTDSLLVQYPAGKKHLIKEFKDEFNKSLPGRMELELEDFYTRGIFVSRKVGNQEKGTKKKYALISESGKIKIKGFELVRRDWSRVARDTQKRVLEVLLKEGSVEKAAKLVMQVVKDLRDGKTPIEDCVIYTELRKKEGKYEIMSPELAALQYAKKTGLKTSDRVVDYVITRSGAKSISERARVLSQAKDYDPDYYINNQVLPAVLRILGALGFDEEGLKNNSQQKGLGDW
ncbi:ribonuclease H-like domain-containing protein [Candidatus Micrarchaeota archaeon]|nr:ribonuclease H-like domain-containing protein [Candidatus Micrarchaeota archaeon]